MFTELKKKDEATKKDKNGEIIFDDLESKTQKLKVNEESKKDTKKYGSPDEINRVVKKKSIKKGDQKASSASLNLTKKESNDTSQRSNSVEIKEGVVAANMGLGIFEAASMMCNIVDITTDSTNKNMKSQKQLKSKDSKTSMGSTSSGPFAQMKEAQEMKRRSKHSFDQDDNDDNDNHDNYN